MGLNEIMSTFIVYQYSDTSVVDEPVKTEGINSGYSCHGMKADMGLKWGRVKSWVRLEWNGMRVRCISYGCSAGVSSGGGKSSESAMKNKTQPTPVRRAPFFITIIA